MVDRISSARALARESASQSRSTSQPETDDGEGARPRGDLRRRFEDFTAEAEAFSRELRGRTGPLFMPGASRFAAQNVEISKTVFGKWSIEILSVLYPLKGLGFQELRGHLGGISARVLSQKLRTLEGQGLVERTVLGTRPTRVRYALTPDGLTVAKLGEPVFLFLRSRRRPGNDEGGGANSLDWTGSEANATSLAKT